jgi:hypothetical protein
MLQIRMREGITINSFTAEQRSMLEQFNSRKLFESESWSVGRLVLSLEGRLLADQIVRELLS